MAVPVSEQRKLLQRSGNVCAFPQCDKSLTTQATKDDPLITLGAIAHIVADSPNGPRGVSPLTKEQRNQYTNLILLCEEHHRVIDSQPQIWTVEKLHLIKRDHEDWVQRSLKKVDAPMGGPADAAHVGRDVITIDSVRGSVNTGHTTAEPHSKSKGRYWRIRLYLVGSVLLVAVPVLIVSVPPVWSPWSTKSLASPVAHAKVSLIPPSGDAFVPKSIGQLPAPPAYSPDQSTNHCGVWWPTWLPQQGAAEDGDLLIEIAAPQSADVTVVGASIQIFRSYRPANVSYIECSRAGGSSPGTLLKVNLDRPHAKPTIIADDGRDMVLSMPNADINIDPGHTEYVEVVPKGSNLFYEWSIRLQVVVNQQSETYTFGSAQHPLLRYFGDRSTAYDYDSMTNTWRRAATGE